MAMYAVNHLWLCVLHSCQTRTPHVRRGDPIVSEMEYSPQLDCLVVLHEDAEAAFYHGVTVFDLAVECQSLYSAHHYECALQMPTPCAFRGCVFLAITCAAQGGLIHYGVHAAGRRLRQ